MKPTTKGIITDLCSDDIIISRWMEEYPRVHRWAEKLAKDEKNILPANFTHDEVTGEVAFKDEMAIRKCTMKNLGIIPWTSPVSGDTWFSIMQAFDGQITMSTYYFWNTIGSIGMIHNGLVQDDKRETSYRVLYVISSHAMLRYRDRMNMNDTSPFELVTRLADDFSTSSLSVHTGENGECWQLTNKDGVFRGNFKSDDTEREYVVIRFKTFLHKNQLSRRDYIEYTKLREQNEKRFEYYNR